MKAMFAAPPISDALAIANRSNRSANNVNLRTAPVLAVDNLQVSALTDKGQQIPILRGVSFGIFPGERLGILGESGCGKSTLARSLLGILPRDLRLSAGSITLSGLQLAGTSERQLRTLRGNTISLVHQEAEGALHPLMRVRDQVAEIFRAHREWSYRRCGVEALNVLEEVFGSDVERMARAYPHELSGGQRQRVLIAQAIACRPKILIADEPTASLDPTTQGEILSLLQSLTRHHGASLLVISHNPTVLRELSTHILVMYFGQIIEQGSCEEIFGNPLHPYTRALLRLQRDSTAFGASGKRELAVIPGNSPEEINALDGCSFAPRCEHRMADCTTVEPQLLSISEIRRVRCVLYEH